MKLDSVTSMKIINNQRLMRATHRGEYRDLGGALAITSDSPLPQWNCIEGFTTSEGRLEGLLDIGFSLLRAFDREAAVRLTPLDRPAAIEQRLRGRQLVEIERETSMVLRGNVAAVAVNEAVQVKRAEPDDASTFATVETQARGLKRRAFLLGAALANVLDPDHVFYLAYSGGEAVGTALTVRDGATVGLYAVTTLKAHRKQGVATALVARAVRDAQSAGAELICLETVAGSDAMRLYGALGFEPAHDTVLWSTR
jgi:GNAT superfamily N-acetyltransferase